MEERNQQLYGNENAGSSFFAMMSRMKYINRWALMRNSYPENISEHSLEVGMLAHVLTLIGNKKCGKNLNEGPCMCEEEGSDLRMSAIREVFEKFKEV